MNGSDTGDLGFDYGGGEIMDPGLAVGSYKILDKNLHLLLTNCLAINES